MNITRIYKKYQFLPIGLALSYKIENVISLNIKRFTNVVRKLPEMLLLEQTHFPYPQYNLQT